MPAPWSEVLRTNKLILPEEMTKIMLFGPDVSRINRGDGQLQRHMMHGYMILREAIHAAVDRAPIMMTPDLWVRLLDHRGWKALWGDLREQNEEARANIEQIRGFFARFVKNEAGEYPQPWAEAKYNGRVYKPIVIEIEDETISKTSEPGPSDSKRTRRAKKKARKLQEESALGAQNVESRATKSVQRLEDLPDADWDYLLWEMIEINHQGELRALQFLFHDAGHIAQINQYIMTKMLGPREAAGLPERSGGLSPSSAGLAGVTTERRRRSIVALLGLMSKWKIGNVPFLSVHPDLAVYLQAVTAEPQRLPGEDGLDSAEKQEVAVLHQWARMFVEKFGRAPTAPRLCPAFEKI